MPDPIRTFIAIKIPADTPLRRVLKKLSEMGRPIKAVEPDNLHVTLKFLGSTDVTLLDSIRTIVADAAHKQPGAKLDIVGLGAFPHADRPTVIWAGLEGPGTNTLSALATTFEDRLAALGFPREERAFAPHLTLARVKARPPQSLHDLMAANSKTIFGSATVSEIEFIRSEPRPDGARYTVLERCPLSGISN